MISILNQQFSKLNQFIEGLKPTQLFILVDENTHDKCLPVFLPELETEIPYEIIEIEAGEELKNIETAKQLWEILAEFEADRNSLLINLGGGVITDLGGFVASTYKRGIPFINLPTSLLGMCDAAIGGKTGIDLMSLKNIVGTFAVARHTFIFSPFLKTLPFVELRSGFAEMLKHGLIADKNHWESLIDINQLTVNNISTHIEASMKIKQDLVEKDFREENCRKTLNFGHTFGHAIESLFLQKSAVIPHGEAVALGMIMETYLSYLENLIPETTAKFIINSLRRFYPYINIEDFTDNEIILKMQNDKKNVGDSIRFSLLEDIGKCNFNFAASHENINRVLQFYRNLKDNVPSR